ncbi:MAG: HAMP domain-containing sensor histidine kinase [Sideroxydans sp.]|nr:HAMP domain-containing sensor histidine kinase [Sideroxydans sp.]
MTTFFQKTGGLDAAQQPSLITPDNFAVRAAQLRARLDDYPLMLIAAPASIGCLLVILFWDVLAHRTLLAWLGVMAATQAVELFVWWQAQHGTQTFTQVRLWHRRLGMMVLVAGLVWGAAGVLLFTPHNLAYQFLLTSIELGVVCGSVMVHPLHLISWRWSLGLVVLPLAMRHLYEFDFTHSLVALMLLMYYGYLWRGGSTWSRLLENLWQRDAEKQQLVDQLQLAKLRAETATQQKSRFLASASHDLRQPMQALTLFVEALKMQPHTPQAQPLVAQIALSVEVLGDMFNSLLELSKLDSGGVRAHFAPFELQPLMQRMQAEFSVLAQQKNLTFSLDCRAAYVLSDAELVERVLRNLLSNALRYTEQGAVSLSCEREASGVRIVIRDTGIGIAPEHLAHIFEEYYQAENAHRQRSNGLGLGLAIVQRLDSLLDLHLQVKSVAGQGSEFSFIVPYA